MGLDFDIIQAADTRQYEIVMPNGRLIILSDVLFAHGDNAYLEKKILPQSIKEFDLVLGTEKFNFPILFGDEKVEIKKDQISLGMDLFGSIFFMLSRYEESFLNERDNHNRFPLSSSNAFKLGYHLKPLVDFYVHFLGYCFQFIDSETKLKKPSFNIMPSHDIDYLVKYTGLRSVFGALKRALIEEVSLKNAAKYLKDSMSEKDPYDQTDFFISNAEKKGIKSTFYLLVGGNSDKDPKHFTKYRAEAKKLINKVLDSGHNLGLHPSYSSYNNIDLLKSEKMFLEEMCGREIIDSRQHYLRFHVAKTWQLLDKTGIRTDSSLGYPESPGYRCGTSMKFKVFDIETRSELQLEELPLLIMDTSVLNSQEGIEAEMRKIHSLKKNFKKYGGNWTFLIHNSNLYWKGEQDYHNLWEDLYKV